jgi:hypothetical protein
MAPLAVDPAALDGAGAAVVAVGEGLGSVISTLSTALSGTGGMAGDDPAGGALGRSYDSSTAKLIEAMAATRNGLCRLGDGVRMSAHNYSLAEAMSDVAGHSDALPVPPSTGSISAGLPPSAVGTATSAPAGWGWVAPYIGMIWPTGDSAKLRAAAAAWSAAGTEFEVTEVLGALGPMGDIRAQQIPEGAAIDAAFTEAYRSAASILQQCASIAAQLSAYAAKIDQVHAAILDLLARICDPMTGLKEVWDVLTDKDEDEIQKIANDIRTVVNNFTSEVDALRHQIGATLSEATTVLTTMGRYAAKEWDQFLHGTEVGRALNQVGQFGKGLGEEAGGLLKDNWTYGPLRAMVDPQGWYHSWKDMVGGMAPLVGLGGEHAPGVGQAWKDLGKEVSHWDDWASNPAEAAGKSTFDIATLFAPGGAAGAAGKGGHAAADAAEAATKAARGEAAASRSLGDAAKSAPSAGAPATAPHPRVEAPVERPPAPAEKPAAPVPAKPGSAPADGALPHGPTESRPPVAGTPLTDGTPRTTAETSPSGTGHGPAGQQHAPISDPTPGSQAPSASAPTEMATTPPAHPAESTPSTNHPSQPGAGHAPNASQTRTPHPPTPGRHPPQAPPPHDGGAQGGYAAEPPTPHDGAPHAPGDGGSPGTHPPGDGSSTEHGSTYGGDGTNADVPHGTFGAHGPAAVEPKVPGIDYPFSPADALQVLERPEAEIGRLADGGVPQKLLDGYDPLAGRTPEDFKQEFTVPGANGEPRWDWDNQAPHNGFAEIPEVSEHLPKGFHLDRVGPNGGGYLSPEGTPLGQRATPPGLAAQYHRFEGTGLPPTDPDLDWRVLHGPAKDAFGQPGGGEQWVVIDNATGDPVPVDDLVEQGMLSELDPTEAHPSAADPEAGVPAGDPPEPVRSE